MVEDASDDSYTPMNTSAAREDLEENHGGSVGAVGSSVVTATPSPSQPPSTNEVIASAAFCGLSFLVHIANPHERPLPYEYLENSQEYVRDLSHSENFDSDTVSDAMLLVLAALFPVAVQLSVAQYWQKRGWKATLCCYFVAFGLNSLTTESVKLYVGYLRPSFYQLCEPDEEYQDCTSSEASDARKSFPSGHASQSFCGLVLLTLFLHKSFGVPSSRTTSMVRPSHRLASVLALLPVALAIFIAASRVHDNKHFPADVVGGALLGGSIANYCHGLYF